MFRLTRPLKQIYFPIEVKIVITFGSVVTNVTNFRLAAEK